MNYQKLRPRSLSNAVSSQGFNSFILPMDAGAGVRPGRNRIFLGATAQDFGHLRRHVPLGSLCAGSARMVRLAMPRRCAPVAGRGCCQRRCEPCGGSPPLPSSSVPDAQRAWFGRPFISYYAAIVIALSHQLKRAAAARALCVAHGCE